MCGPGIQDSPVRHGLSRRLEGHGNDLQPESTLFYQQGLVVLSCLFEAVWDKRFIT